MSVPPADIILVVNDIFNSSGDTSNSCAAMFSEFVLLSDTTEPPSKKKKLKQQKNINKYDCTQITTAKSSIAKCKSLSLYIYCIYQFAKRTWLFQPRHNATQSHVECFTCQIVEQVNAPTVDNFLTVQVFTTLVSRAKLNRILL